MVQQFRLRRNVASNASGCGGDAFGSNSQFRFAFELLTWRVAIRPICGRKLFSADGTIPPGVNNIGGSELRLTIPEPGSLLLTMIGSIIGCAMIRSKRPAR